MKKLATFSFSLALLGALFLVACGGDDDGGDSGTTAATATRPATTPAGAGVAPPATPTPGGPPVVTMVDLGYQPSSLTARAGQEVKLALRNGGELPHTFTITGIVDSGTMNPRDTKEISFTPAGAGTLVYFCTVHGQAAMSGQLVVSAGAQAPPTNPPGGAGAAAPPASPSDASTDHGY